MRLFSAILNFIKIHKAIIILLIIFIIHIFLRFYQLERRLNFGLDQADNASIAKSIIVDHNFPLVGMVAKGNSGFHIGPLYYYFVAVIYWIFNFNPISSGVVAGLASVITFFAIYFVAKKLFSNNIALISVGIHTVSYFVIESDRLQWPVNLITPISFLIFYSLYRVLTGRVKYLLFLSAMLGLSLHIHFTSVFYFIITFLTLPFFPRTKKTIKYILFSIPIFLLFMVPNIISEISKGSSETGNLLAYVNTYYHGFHLTRVLQLTNDAFIELQLIMKGWFHDMNYLVVIAFFIVYLFSKRSRGKYIMSYLIALWLIVPWFAFSVYKGEISNYYFFSTRPIAILILAYLTYRIYNVRNILPKIAIIIFWLYFSYVNVSRFFIPTHGNLKENTDRVKEILQRREEIKDYPFTPESYLKYYYTREG
jgi:4-amino-4-deoxy-L-arabinose transferase-like glycosyltransferase